MLDWDILAMVVVMIVVAIMVAVTIPVAILVPTTFAPVPPTVIGVPATFPLGIQITPPLVCLVAALAMFSNSLIQLGFPTLNLALAFCMVGRVCVCSRCCDQCCRTQSTGNKCR